MIGYYVHHHGSGHLRRMQSIRSHLGDDVTVLSSLSRPEGYDGQWLELDRDDAAGRPEDVTAQGTFHWAPRLDTGLRRRMTKLVSWIDRARPAAIVVDVSVEVATLARLCGVPVVVVAMPGERDDRPHRLAYDLADALIAPWPARPAPEWPREWIAKTRFVGAISQFAGRRAVVEPLTGDTNVFLLWGTGGAGLPPDVNEVRAATPGWTWTIAGGERWMSRDAVWTSLCSADVVVTHAGQNAVADVAMAGARAVVVADHRPFGEQRHTVQALRRLGIGVPVSEWPSPGRWADVLSRAAGTDPDRWALWRGDGARGAAEVIEEVTRCRSSPS